MPTRKPATVSFNIKIPYTLRDQLRLQADLEGRTLANLIRRMLDQNVRVDLGKKGGPR